MNSFPASLGHYLLRDAQKSGRLWREASALVKNQTERHAANFEALFQVSNNTALFLPINGRYTTPPFLFLIKNARPFVGRLNQKRGVVRKSSLFNVATPECAHGLGCADWLLHCRGVKHISERYLLHVLADFNLSGERIATLSTTRLALTMYLHDTVEDNRKHNRRITPSYVARKTLNLVLNEPFSVMLHPILTADIAALTDDENLHGYERLMAQKIPPQKEYELLRAMGIITEKTFGTGPTGAGKYIDKGHQLTSDLLVAATGQKSHFKSPEDFIHHIVPRLDIVESLHVPESYKTLFRETTERTLEQLKNPRPTPMEPKSAKRLIHHELSRVEKVLAGQPHIPVKRKLYSTPRCA